jgi:hypothetical protein
LRDADNGCEDRRVTTSELEPVALEPVNARTVTVLVDNVTDILLVDEGPARRPAIGAEPRVRRRYSMSARRSTLCGPSTASRPS